MGIEKKDNANFSPNVTIPAKVESFRFWCQKVLPLVYDDSLSYYELLCKVVNYLNNTIIDVNTLGTDVDNINKAYNNLQNYVNDYFSTLDVQEEINNKLDEMARDGSLSALLNPIFNQQNNKIEELTQRVNNITHLSEGSTTGDAELIDIRIPASQNFNGGNAYKNAGESVRGQVAKLEQNNIRNKAFNLLAKTPLYNLTKLSSYFTNDNIYYDYKGTIQQNNAYAVHFFNVEENVTYFINGYYGYSVPMCCWFNQADEIIGYDVYDTTSSGYPNIYLVAPPTAKYCKLNTLKPFVPTIYQCNNESINFSYIDNTIYYTKHENKMYDKNDGIIDYTGLYYIDFDVQPYQKLFITGLSIYGANLITLLDTNNKVIKAYPDINNTEPTYLTYYIEIPKNCNHVYVNGMLKTFNNDKIIQSGAIESKIMNLQNNNTFNRLKKWCAFGDSITDYNTLNGQPNYLTFCSLYDNYNVTNKAHGGTGYYATNNNTLPNFINSLKQINDEYDILTFYGSLNDVSSDCIIGEKGDKGDNTLYGLIYQTLNYAITNFTCSIGVIIPAPWKGTNPFDLNGYYYQKANDYREALIYTCNLFSIPYLDLYYGSNTRPWIESFNNKYYCFNNGSHDGVHPTSEAHLKFLYPPIKNFIKTLC